MKSLLAGVFCLSDKKLGDLNNKAEMSSSKNVTKKIRGFPGEHD
jgi:hypothetical protein